MFFGLPFALEVCVEFLHSSPGPSGFLLISHAFPWAQRALVEFIGGTGASMGSLRKAMLPRIPICAIFAEICMINNTMFENP